MHEMNKPQQIQTTNLPNNEQLPTPSHSPTTSPKQGCSNCKQIGKKCESTIPCLRCIDRGLQDSCALKGRTKGYSRGPYKKRQVKPAKNDFNYYSPVDKFDILSGVCEVLLEEARKNGVL